LRCGLGAQSIALAWRLLLFAEDVGEGPLRFVFALFDLQLAKDRMPANVDLMPLAFEVPQRAFSNFAQETK
jgi:hypothetical protein